MDDIEEYDEGQMGFMKDLQESSKETMMEMIYNAIVNKQHGALNHEASNSTKIEGLTNILNFFKEREEYEKCHEINKIINEYDNNQSI